MIPTKELSEFRMIQIPKGDGITLQYLENLIKEKAQEYHIEMDYFTQIMQKTIAKWRLPLKDRGQWPILIVNSME